MWVSRGLLALVNDEDELAGVIGHEMGHVTASHARKGGCPSFERLAIASRLGLRSRAPGGCPGDDQTGFFVRQAWRAIRMGYAKTLK